MAEEKEEVKVEEKTEVKVEPKVEEKEEVKVEEKKEVEVPEKFKKLVEEIEKMSVLDLSELVKVLEEKFGVSAAPQMMASAPAAGGEAASAEEEKSSFDIVLTGTGEKKIEVIKVVRDLTQKGLKEAKDLVDAVATEPQVIREGVEKKEAEEIKKKFVDAGATIELK
jgi:large subunit ribosomal protein L7/L12